MLTVEMLPGGHGDALVVEWGKGQRIYRMLIDAGTIFSYADVSARLRALPSRKFVLFVVTHVDEDHIGGAISLLEDPNLRHLVSDVWFNGYGQLVKGGNVLGPREGERLSTLIRKGFRWNMDPLTGERLPRSSSDRVGGPVVVPSKGDLPRFDLPGGAVLHLLSPTGPKLKRMAETWEDAIVEAHLVPGRGATSVNRPPPPVPKAGPALDPRITRRRLSALAGKKTAKDGAAANGSSIAFVLEHGGKRVLFGADAHPSVLEKTVPRLATQLGEERLRIDLCKLPHHGSRANVTTRLVEAMECNRYLVSTNGDNFAHPDDEALARVIVSSPDPVTVYCNYPSARVAPWVKRGEPLGATFKLAAGPTKGLRVAV